MVLKLLSLQRHDGITEDTVTGGEAADAVLLSSVQWQDWLWCGVVQAGAQHSPDPIPSHHHPDQTNTTSLSLLSANDCRPHHNNGSGN